MHQDVSIDSGLVRRLIAAQFPHWADLPVEPVEPGGWDNRTFRLGDNMSVRLPSAASYAAQVEKEQRWLPRLAPHLPLPIPVPLAKGAPGEGYPWPWSVYGWLRGRPAANGGIADLTGFARSLANFLLALYRIDANDGPPAGQHNFHRGGRLAVYDTETRAALSALAGRLDTDTAQEVWASALGSGWQRPPVWVHGDVAFGNLLVEDGRLCGVIDFGSSAVGDPACDLVIAWTEFSGESRQAFRDALALDEEAWAGGRGWALWKALITASGHDGNQREAAKS
ncbi:aminoglycoside phosphotransferase family protein [Mesorhizobium amorphae]|uniref:aminoglycoside phosphotransferase family protein n=1 Tax=Mesorhizobium amorphae TaxID=71433 RepID=UPI003ECE6D53